MLTRFGAKLTVEDERGHCHFDALAKQVAAQIPSLVQAIRRRRRSGWSRRRSLPGSDIVVRNVGRTYADELSSAADDERRYPPSSIRAYRWQASRGPALRHAPADRDPRCRPISRRARSTNYPVLFVAAAFASGTTIARGAHRYCASRNRTGSRRCGSRSACGVVCRKSMRDGMAITGSGGMAIRGGARIASETRPPHRRGMVVAGLGAREPSIDDVSPVATRAIRHSSVARCAYRPGN